MGCESKRRDRTKVESLWLHVSLCLSSRSYHVLLVSRLTLSHPSLHCHHADIASHPTIIHSIGYLGEGDGRHIVLNSCWMCTVQGKEDCSLLHLPLDSREIQRRTRSNQVGAAVSFFPRTWRIGLQPSRRAFCDTRAS
jgi:hypothetical protein